MSKKADQKIRRIQSIVLSQNGMSSVKMEPEDKPINVSDLDQACQKLFRNTQFDKENFSIKQLETIESLKYQIDNLTDSFTKTNTNQDEISKIIQNEFGGSSSNFYFQTSSSLSQLGLSNQINRFRLTTEEKSDTSRMRMGKEKRFEFVKILSKVESNMQCDKKGAETGRKFGVFNNKLRRAKSFNKNFEKNQRKNLKILSGLVRGKSSDCHSPVIKRPKKRKKSKKRFYKSLTKKLFLDEKFKKKFSSKKKLSSRLRTAKKKKREKSSARLGIKKRKSSLKKAKSKSKSRSKSKGYNTVNLRMKLFDTKKLEKKTTKSKGLKSNFLKSLKILKNKKNGRIYSKKKRSRIRNMKSFEFCRRSRGFETLAEARESCKRGNLGSINFMNNRILSSTKRLMVSAANLKLS